MIVLVLPVYTEAVWMKSMDTLVAASQVTPGEYVILVSSVPKKLVRKLNYTYVVYVPLLNF